MRIQEHNCKSSKSISKWKTKAVARSKELKQLKQSLRRSQSRAVSWRKKYEALKKANKATHLRNHFYGVEVIWLAVLMRISLNASLRSISGALKHLSAWRGYRCKALSASTIRNWSLRVGLYYLKKPALAGSYVLILDESVGLHKEKMLVLMAIPIDRSCPIRPLKISDGQIWDVQSKASWKGADIADIIRSKQEEAGIDIAYTLCDGGLNLLHGIRLCGLKHIMDCTHALANCSKRLFIKDVPFNTFIKNMNALRAKWVMSKFSPYLPPALRAKSRFHQLFTVSKWANQILYLWDQIPQEAQPDLEFVMQNRSLIITMTKLHELIEQFAAIFKTAGIQSDSLRRWQNVLHQRRYDSIQDKEHYDPKIGQFLKTMNQYLIDQQATLPGNQQILCCSDSIESVFGKYKNKGGSKAISDDIVQVAAYPFNLSQAEVQKALTLVACDYLKNWKSDNSAPPEPSLQKIIKAKMVTQC
jgi:hypothetical protein